MLNSSQPPIDSNDWVAGRYRLLRSLGEGSFGEVFLAADQKFNPPRTVAIKILHSQFLKEPAVLLGIEREASSMARFNHPNILRVLDFDITSKLAYIVTEVAEGGSLDRVIQPDPWKSPVQLPLEDVARYLGQICDALDEAHSAGLVHRDLKPANILLDNRGRPLIADFGLVTAVSNTRKSIRNNVDVEGTPLYMAPEQWLGQAGRASDIYALGVITYEMITGEPPYQGNQFQLMGQHREAPIPKLSDRAPTLRYPSALDDVLAGALAKDYSQRTRPAIEFYRRFRAALNTFGPVVRVQASEGLEKAAQPLAKVEPKLLYTVNGLPRTVLSMAFSPDARRLVSIDGQDDSRLRDAASGREIMRFKQPAGARSLDFSDDGNLLAFGTGQTTIEIWDVANGKKVWNVSDHTYYSYLVGFSPDGRWLAGSTFCTIKFWDVATGREVKNWESGVSEFNSLKFSQDSKLLATGSNDSAIKIWEVPTGKLVRTMRRRHWSKIKSLVFSPDGKLLASGSWDSSVRLWDVTTGEEVRTLSGHANRVHSVAFSPDGKLVASGSSDGTVKLWDVTTGKEVKTLADHSGEVFAVAFSNDGKLATSATDRTIKVWQVLPS